MNDYVRRTLSYATDKGGVVQVDDVEITTFDRPLIVLGEPGMGKTRLLRRIAELPHWTFRSAASFVEHPNPAALVRTGMRLVIDGLDELSAAEESDPVYRVLGQLIKAGCPPFILSCRAADWRGAVARQDISDEYAVAPLELTLEPFSRDSAIEFLVAKLGKKRASEVITYLEDKAIPDLYGNPLTLGLFGEIAARSPELPDTRAELVLKASEIMWNERNDRHDRSRLSNLDRETALAAAGAASAALILTGSEAITLKPSRVGLPRVISVAEVQSLLGGEHVRTLVGSRLFSRIPDAEDQFKPIHRSVAEFLGAKWLSRSTKDSLARERVLGMMTIDSGVPASLRGIHAWLAQNDRFAAEVISTDPYGVLRYGDADGLSISQGRILLDALKRLEQSNPYFRAEDWAHHSAKGLTHIELLDDVRNILFALDTSYHLRTLLLGVIRGSQLAVALEDDLHRMMLSESSRELGYAERYGAAQAIIAIGQTKVHWPALVQRLIKSGDDDSTRLALEIMVDVSFEGFSAELIARGILAHLGLLDNVDADEDEHHTAGPLFTVARRLPDARVAGVLDAIADHLSSGDTRKDFRIRSELLNTVSELIARQAEIAMPGPVTLLKWLRITPAHQGYSHEDGSTITAIIERSPDLRREIQRHVVFNERDREDLWRRNWDLSELNHSLTLRIDDIIYFLNECASEPDRSDAGVALWRELATMARRSDTRTDEVLNTARLYAEGHPSLEEYLKELAKPLPLPDWQVEQEKRATRERRKKQRAWNRHRKDFNDNIEALRTG